MTVPRNIGIQQVGDKFMLTSTPAGELDALNEEGKTLTNIDAADVDITASTGNLQGPARLRFHSDKIESFTITLSNENGEQFILGYDKAANNYFMDRSKSGNIDFEKGFGVRHTAPRIAQNNSLDIDLIIDNASAELFADGGLSVMTGIFFPSKIYSVIRIQSPAGLTIKSLQFNRMKTIWKN